MPLTSFQGDLSWNENATNIVPGRPVMAGKCHYDRSRETFLGTNMPLRSFQGDLSWHENATKIIPGRPVMAGKQVTLA